MKLYDKVKSDFYKKEKISKWVYRIHTSLVTLFTILLMLLFSDVLPKLPFNVGGAYIIALLSLSFITVGIMLYVNTKYRYIKDLDVSKEDIDSFPMYLAEYEVRTQPIVYDVTDKMLETIKFEYPNLVMLRESLLKFFTYAKLKELTDEYHKLGVIKKLNVEI